MGRVIMAEVHLRDVCDPSTPGDCAPLIRIPGASEIEALVSDHGIEFAELSEEIPGEIPEAPEGWGGGEAREVAEAPEPVGLVCSLEPDRPWDESVCREVTGFDEAQVLVIRDAVANSLADSWNKAKNRMGGG